LVQFFTVSTKKLLLAAEEKMPVIDMGREVTLEFIRVTEAAALKASRWMGRGDKEAADQAAVDAMRSVRKWAAAACETPR
jgi:hypothetical protein